MRLLLWLVIFITSVGNATMVETKLSNGVKILVKETQGRGIVSGVLFFKGGKHGELKRGETHLLFTLLLKGSKTYPTSYHISLPFEELGGFIYSSSGDDFSEIGFSTKQEGIRSALEVIGDILTSPLFKEEDIEREKNNTVMAIRSKRERGMEFAMEHLRRLTFRGTPYETSPLGTEKDVMSLKREDIIRRFKEIVRSGNIVVSIVGDIKAEYLIPLLEETLGKIPEGELTLAEAENPVRESKVLRIKREGTQTTILCAFNAPPLKDRDYFTFKVLNSALGDGMTSKLFRELREKRGYAYAVYSFYPTRFTSPRMFAYVGTSPTKADGALEDLIALIREPQLSEEDINIAKKKIVGDFLLDHQTRLRQAWYLGFYEIMGFGWEMDLRYPDFISKVSLKEIERAIVKYLDKYHCVMVEPGGD